jgi:hypothetical protein
MLKQNCDCGCLVFYVNRKTNIIECSLCKKRFEFKNNNWKEIELIKIEKIISTKEKIKNFVCDSFESIGEYRKRLNIEKINKKLICNKEEVTNDEFTLLNNYNKEKEIEKKQLEKIWEKELCYLKNNNIISFTRNEHKGKLRGKHIAKKLHSDLKKIGMKNKLYFRSNKVIVELIGV